jgi:hypothetical protein
VPLLTFADIISTYNVHSERGCSFRCLNEPTCVGFKYKHGVNSPSVNCQLSNSTGENDMADDDDQGWVFFVDIKSKLVRKEFDIFRLIIITFNMLHQSFHSRASCSKLD